MAFSTFLRKYVRAAPAGAGQNAVTVTAKRHADDASVGSAATAGTGDEAGLATITLTDYEPHYLSATVGADTLMASSRDVGFIGTISGYDLDLFGLLWTDGVVKGRDNELAATAAGSDMEVDLATGAVMVLGHGARNTASAAVVIGANASGSTRHDLIVVRFVPRGQTTEGDFSFAVVAGTPGAGIPPAVTQSAAVWEIPIASVSVANGAATISTGNLTDLRVFCYPRALDLDSATLAGALPITGGGTGAATAATARTNLGAAAKAGDTITGQLVVKPDPALTQAFVVQRPDSTAALWVDTLTGGGTGTTVRGQLTITGSVADQLLVEESDGTDVLAINLSGANRVLDFLNGTDVHAFAADAGGTALLDYDGATGALILRGPVRILETTNGLSVENDAGTSHLYINSNAAPKPLIAARNGAQIVAYSGDLVGALFRVGGDTAEVFIANGLTPAIPAGGGHLYVEGGSLKYRGSSGSITVLAPA